MHLRQAMAVRAGYLHHDLCSEARTDALQRSLRKRIESV